MAFLALRMAAISPSHLSGIKSSHADIRIRQCPPSQVRCKGESGGEVPKPLSVKRRDAVVGFTTLLMIGISVSSTPEIAEARITKKEMRKKILEKLEKLREKAGLPKEKDDDKEKSPSKPPSSKKENVLILEPPFPLPNPPQGLENSLVETTLL